jgi:uncharacterized membrane protein
MTQQAGNSDITSDDKLWAALGYPVPVIALIMLFLEDKKKRAFIKFHAVHALVLIVGVIAVQIVFGILQVVLSSLNIGIVGTVLGCVTPLVWLLLLWPAILAFQGKYFEIPVITKFVRGQHWVA